MIVNVRFNVVFRLSVKVDILVVNVMSCNMVIDFIMVSMVWVIGSLVVNSLLNI